MMYRIACLGLMLCAAIGGCTSSTPIIVDTPVDATQEHLMRISTAYIRSVQSGKVPKGPEDLLPLLKDSGDPQQILRSPRDGQPFVICWGINLLKPITWQKPNSTPVLAYEKQGAEGTRWVLTAVRSVEKLSEQQFRESSFPPDHKPAF